MSQADKVFLNLAGEFAVASELNRRRVLASITYGAAKSADVFALSADMSKVARVEVKTTGSDTWVVGEKATREPSRVPTMFWVLVKLPPASNDPADDDASRGRHAPRYFILSAPEMHQAWRKRADKYRAAYRGRHGHDFVGIGVPKVTLDGVAAFEGRWRTILTALE
jgi:hypothetical protein